MSEKHNHQTPDQQLTGEENQELITETNEQTEIDRAVSKYVLDESKLTDKQILALRSVELEQLKTKNQKLRKRITNQKAKFNKQLDEGLISRSGQEPLKNGKKLNLKKFEVQLREYMKRQVYKDLGLIILGALLCTIAYDYFIGATTKDGLFPPGVAAIARQVAIFTPPAPSQDTYYFMYYILFNLPLFIFGIIKVGWRFSILTIISLVFQNVFNIIIYQIPVINPNDFKMIIDFVYESKIGDNSALYLVWIFVFAIVGAIVYGVAYAFLYMSGGSSAGTDFISAYFQKKYRKSIATINKFINIGIVLIILCVHTVVMTKAEVLQYFHAGTFKNGVFTPGNFSDYDVALFKLKFFFGPTTFGSLLFVVVQAMVINSVYPKFKFKSLAIYTKKGQHLVEALSFKGFHNLIQISEATIFAEGEYQKVDKVTITINSLEYKQVIAIMKVIDPHAHLVSRKVDRVFGKTIIKES